MNPQVLAGKPVVKGARISVEPVVDLLARGYTPEQIGQQDDHLAAGDIRACPADAGDVRSSERVYAVRTA